jgi:hypothetical protein
MDADESISQNVESEEYAEEICFGDEAPDRVTEDMM